MKLAADYLRAAEYEVLAPFLEPEDPDAVLFTEERSAADESPFLQEEYAPHLDEMPEGPDAGPFTEERSAADDSPLLLEYSDYLDEIGMAYHTHSETGFAVDYLDPIGGPGCVVIVPARFSFAGGNDPYDFILSEFIATMDIDREEAEKLEKALDNALPDSCIYVIFENKYEIGVEKKVHCTSVQELHACVMGTIDAIRTAYEVGYEMFGDEFKR